MNEHRLVMTGMPAAGKTTFLAALWSLGISPHANVSYRTEYIEGDVGYLNKIGLAWAECTELGHTEFSRVESCVLRLRDARLGTSERLAIPDLSGEVFVHLLKERAWDSRVAGPLLETEGLLLFVNCEKVQEPAWIFESEAPADTPTTPWSPELIPTQTQLVDLLQCICDLRSHRETRLAIMVSAWDRAASIYADPSLWMSDHLPLLTQYLVANSLVWPNKAFGISAQGGPLPQDEARLLAMSPDERPFIVEGAASTSSADVALSPHDLGAPVRWLVAR